MKTSKTHRFWFYRKLTLLKDLWFFGWMRQVFFFFRYRNESISGKVILIYGQGRTGSTLLAQSLARHPGVVYHQEALRRKVFHIRSFISGLLGSAKGDWYVLKVKPMHLSLQDIHLTELLGFIEDSAMIRIHLIREDHFEHAISKIVAAERNEYAKRAAGHKVFIDPSYLRAKMIELKQMAQQEQDDCGGLGFTSFSYEGNLRNPESLLNSVNQVLSLAALGDLEYLPTTYKVLSFDLSTEIENWEEVSSVGIN